MSKVADHSRLFLSTLDLGPWTLDFGPNQLGRDTNALPVGPDCRAGPRTQTRSPARQAGPTRDGTRRLGPASPRSASPMSKVADHSALVPFDFGLWTLDFGPDHSGRDTFFTGGESGLTGGRRGRKERRGSSWLRDLCALLFSAFPPRRTGEGGVGMRRGGAPGMDPRSGRKKDPCRGGDPFSL